MKFKFETSVETRAETNYEERKLEQLVKPVTAIISHIPLQAAPIGLYCGLERDLLVVTSSYGKEGLQLHADCSKRLIDNVLPQIDCLAGYLGINGASYGFYYILEERKKRKLVNKEVFEAVLVASRENKGLKKDWCRGYILPIIWTEYFGEAMVLEEIAKDAMKGRKYVPCAELYL